MIGLLWLDDPVALLPSDTETGPGSSVWTSQDWRLKVRARCVRGTFVALAGVVLLGTSIAQPAIPPKYKAAPDEVAQLPRYCYNQYVDGALGGYTYSIPHESCGAAMNHFCPALVYLIRAQKMSVRRAERVGYVQSALGEIDYTIRDMKPGCFIAKDVFAAKERARVLATIIK